MSRPSTGGASLRSVRLRARLTQGQLSTASGVSVRAIRGLERGEILTPQLATLQQLALALHLGPQAQAEFMHAWSTPRPVGLDQLLVDPSRPELEQIQQLTRSALGTYRVISQVWRTRVSADRRLTHTGCHSGIAAVADGLDRVFNVQSGDAGTSDRPRVHPAARLRAHQPTGLPGEQRRRLRDRAQPDTGEGRDARLRVRDRRPGAARGSHRLRRLRLGPAAHGAPSSSPWTSRCRPRP